MKLFDRHPREWLDPTVQHVLSCLWPEEFPAAAPLEICNELSKFKSGKVWHLSPRDKSPLNVPSHFWLHSDASVDYLARRHQHHFHCPHCNSTSQIDAEHSGLVITEVRKALHGTGHPAWDRDPYAFCKLYESDVVRVMGALDVHTSYGASVHT